MIRPQRLVPLTVLVAVLCVGSVLLLTWGSTGSQPVADLRITPPYILVRETRLGPLVLAVYRARVRNTGPTAFRRVHATLIDRPQNVQVLDRRLTFGTVPAGTTVTSRDTFLVVRQHRVPFNPATLVWDITGTPVATNSPPVAQAGADQTVGVGQTVTLDGSRSSDADGDPLQYHWVFSSKPTGSAAVLDDPTAVRPTFLVDRRGSYSVELIVHDGTTPSAPDTVTITTQNSRPVAEAGPHQTVFVGDTVQLDGSLSHDADGDSLAYHWSLSVTPAGSLAAISDPASVAPTFDIDLPGRYVAQLIVHDGQLPSEPETVTITTENRPPVLAPLAEQRVVVGTTLTLQLSATDPDGDPLTFTVEPLPAHASLNATTGLFTFTPVEAQVGTLPLTFTVSDGDRTDAQAVDITVERPVPVCLAPTITAVTPTTGAVGTEVTITGTHLDCGTTPTLSFNGVPAIITFLSATVIKTFIPLGGEDGLFTLTTAGGTVTAPPGFGVDVVPSRDFALAVVPGSGQVLQGAATTYTVELQSRGAAAFTDLAAIAVTGLPTGVTAILASPMLTGGQRATLTVSADAAAPGGTSTLTLQATATVDTTPVTRTATFVLDVQAGGRTAVVGQFTLIDGTLLAGVKLALGGKNTQTDSGGNFQLLDLPEGTLPLSIDVTPVDPQLPMYGMDVTTVAGQITQLPPFRIHPPLPPERFTPIVQNATQDQVITDPRYPGVAFTIPAGVTIIGWDGVPKTRMGFERLSPDALPVPPPPGPTRSVYQPFFGTPMGGLPSAPIPVTAPNDLDLKPGQQAELWYYDAAPFPGVPGAWRMAGLGTVSQDGTTIVSDPGVGIQRFCGVCGMFCFIARQLEQLNRFLDSFTAADPVDLDLGQLIVEKTDLVLPGRIPAVIHRTYNPLDPFGGIAGFELGLGPGWALSVEVVLQAETSSLRRLILPGNARFAFFLQRDGTFANTTNRHFAGAVLTTETGDGHTLRLKDGTIWHFTPSASIAGLSLLGEQTDRNGNRLTIERDSSGRVTRLIEPSGRELVLTYAAGRITEIRDPLGRTVRYGYNSDRRLETVTDPAGSVTRYTYIPYPDITGRILTITDARGITYLTNEYGRNQDGAFEQGRLTRQTQADGGEWTFEYFHDCPLSFGPGGVPVDLLTHEECERFVRWLIETRVTDPRGYTTAHRIVGSGVTDALGQKTQFVRDYKGQLLSIHDPLGLETRFEYDAAGNVTQMTDPAGNIRHLEYEPTFNKLTRLTDALENVTILAYDARGNLTRITDPLGQVTQIAYNAFGQPVSTTDALGNVTTFTYDAQGNLMTITDPLGNTTEQVYDEVSRLIAQTDPRGRTTHYTYDVLNRLTEIVDALNGVTSFTYDANDNLLSVTDALGHATTYEYDNMDRLIRRTDPVGASESFAYDAMGNLIRHTDRKGQETTFNYDALNRRIEASYADGTITTFTYDAVGRLVHASDTAEGDVLHTYDVLDRLIQQTIGLGTVEYTYDALGRRASMRVPRQAPVTYSYDKNSRLTQLTQGTQAVDFAYDALDRQTRLTLPNGVTTEASYDAASRLTELVYRNTTGALGNLTYQYDAAGNRTHMGGSFARTLLPRPVALASYDAANRQHTFGNKQMTFDTNGSLTSMTDPGGVTTFTWDARNRLTVLTGPSLNAAFAYDSLGRRSIRQVNGARTNFLYDDIDPVQELSGTSVTANMLSGLGLDSTSPVPMPAGLTLYSPMCWGQLLPCRTMRGWCKAPTPMSPMGGPRQLALRIPIPFSTQGGKMMAPACITIAPATICQACSGLSAKIPWASWPGISICMHMWEGIQLTTLILQVLYGKNYLYIWQKD
jgi:YD repeat-containing protein